MGVLRPPGDIQADYRCAAPLFGRDIGVDLDEGATVDYAELCAMHLSKLSDSMIDRICESVIRYCHFVEEASGEVLTEYVNPRDVFDQVVPGYMLVCEAPDDGQPIVHIEAECEWKSEHGLELLIRGDELCYVGEFQGCYPVGDYSSTEERGHAL